MKRETNVEEAHIEIYRTGSRREGFITYYTTRGGERPVTWFYARAKHGSAKHRNCWVNPGGLSDALIIPQEARSLSPARLPQPLRTRIAEYYAAQEESV